MYALSRGPMRKKAVDVKQGYAQTVNNWILQFIFLAFFCSK